MLKLMYLAERKPGFTADEFVRRWRMHGARGMEGAFWRHVLGYVQAETIRPAPLAGASEEFDAIACFMLRDDAFAEPPDSAESGRMAQDELETFSAPIPTTSLWVNEERLEDGELGGTTAFLFFADPSRAREVAERARVEGGVRFEEPGVYEDVLEKTDGNWRFVPRRFTILHFQSDESENVLL